MNLERSSPFRPANDPNAPLLARIGRRSTTPNLFTQPYNPFALPNWSHPLDPMSGYPPGVGMPVNPYLNLHPAYRPAGGGLHSGVTLTPGLGLGNQLTSLRPAANGLGNNSLSFLSSHYNDHYSRDRERELGRNYNALWRPVDLPCSTSSSSCRSNRAGGYNFATKDIVVRGSARVIRASYLQENSKFEFDLSKYLDKKNKSQVPDRVVDLLISFINEDSYENTIILDEVTLNILAHNVGAKSVVEFSLKRLNNLDDVDLYELGPIVATVLMCSKVDKGLTSWLKGMLEKGHKWRFLRRTRGFEDILDERPELLTEVERLVEARPSPKDNGFRSL